MNGTKMLNKALGLLGYSENDGNPQLTQRVRSRALSLCNLVYTDLRSVCGLEYKELESLTDEIELPEKAIEIFACGLAGYIAQSEGDDNSQYFWSSEYQTRRVKLSQVTAYTDALPAVE
jgi:hypothetical protein